MKSRDFGVLLFGLAGLYSLLLALLGVAQLLMQVPASTAMAGGQLRIQATFVSAVLSVLLHLAFGALLLGGRRRLTLWLLGEEAASADSARGTGRTTAGARVAVVQPGTPPAAGARVAGMQAGTPPAAGAEPAGGALGFATVGVCLLAVLLLARVVTALSYAVSLLWLRGGGNSGDYVFWTAGGVVTDLLLAAVGGALIARRHRIAARLLAGPPGSAGTAPGAGWQLPAARFLGLTVLVWYLPELTSAVSVFVKWGLRPVGFDLRAQALDRIPPAATGVLAGLYLFWLFPTGLSVVSRRLQPPRERREQREQE
ncbi:MAG: hypothetical protein JOZ15_06410 [Acidobacteria bacterium]|nr:hypothetical protein [Acidobacteriota bacterium]